MRIILAKTIIPIRFLWVSFQLDTVCSQAADADILGILKDLPKDLPETFNRHLRKLHQSEVCDPDLRKNVFRILSAAQRPLTLEELRHAVSIIPGTTAWDTRKLVNNMMKIVDACGSLLIVDEEEMTIQFAHYSIKQHLLSSPTDSIVKQYHVNLNEADIRLGEICCTYLSLNVLSMQLHKSAEHARTIEPINIPSAIFASQSRLVNKVAIQLLKATRNSSYDLQHQLQKAASQTQAPAAEQSYSFISYAQDHWLFHSRKFELKAVSNVESFYLWISLIEGVPGVTLPWAPEFVYYFGSQVSNWILDNQHGALLKQVLQYKERGVKDENFGKHLLPHGEREKKLVRFLSTWGESLKIEARFFENAFEIASKLNDQAVKLFLLEKGVQVNPKDSEVSRLLHNATIEGRLHIVKMLLANGADINLRKFYGNRRTPLEQAGDGGSWEPEIMRLLLQNGADTETRYGDGTTLLHRQVCCNCLWRVQLLLEKGADVEARTTDGRTPLFLAVEYGYIEVVKLLIERRANINTRTRSENTPLHVAAKNYGPSVLLVKLLLEHGANPIAKNDSGLTPKDIARLHNHNNTTLLDNWITSHKAKSF